MNALIPIVPRWRHIAPALLLSLAACQSAVRPPMPAVDHVDLPRYMGKWYVVASIPTPLETRAYDAVETYTLMPDGRVGIRFSFHEGGFDGPRKSYDSTGRILDAATNAVWGVQFIWPFEADYRVIYLAQDYSLTVIGRERRDYAWIMSRSPQLPQADYDRMVTLLADYGYEPAQLRRVPQR